MYNWRKNIQQHLFVYITCFIVISKCNIWDDCNSEWSLIHSKNLGDLSLVILINRIFIKRVFMHWCASTRHNWKIREYSRTSSVLFTVRKLEVWELQILRIFFHLRKLEISLISRFLILVLILNSKTQKLRNIFKICKFQRKCFICGSKKFPSFPSFRFWLLY